MERKFLEGLGITDKETIDKILDQNGAEVGALNTRIKPKIRRSALYGPT